MDMDGFDPSSLLEFAMEENDGVVNNNVDFEDPGCIVNQNKLDNDHVINLVPDNSDPQILTADKNVTDQIISDIGPGNSVIKDVESGNSVIRDVEPGNSVIRDFEAGNSVISNVDPCSSVISDVDPGNSVSGHENNTVTISSKQNVGPIIAGELGMDNMCSVPISMFHMFNLDDHFDNNFEKEGQDTPPVVENVPKKSDTSVKKLLPIVYSEKTYRKNLFKNSPDTIKLFKLHCTVCTKHIGCSPTAVERILRVHRDLNVIMCRNCFDFYGNGNFPVEEGSEIYCEWCGQGGTIFCCSNCPKVFCESCIILNFGIDRRNQIEAISTWSCFACNPSELWPHRAICWGLQKHIRESRAKLPILDKEERQTFLNKDISDCCLKSGVVSPIPLPPQPQLQKVPICLFADKHSKRIITSLKDNRLSTVRNNQTVFIRKDKLNKQKPRTPPVPSKQKIIPQVTLVQQQKPVIPQVQTTTHNGTQQIIPNHLQQALQGFGRPTNSRYFNCPPVEVISLEDDNEARPTMLQTPLPGHINLDLRWLQTAVKESSHCLFKFQSLLNQFDLLSGKLRTDIDQVNEFTSKLHSLFKITISSLAKIDYNMLQDLKNCTMPTVRNYSGITIMKKPEAPQLVAQQLVAETKKKPETTILPSSDILRVPVTPSSVPSTVPVMASEPSEEEDLNCLLFCETVMTETGDGNKENEFNINNNFIQKDTRLNTVPVPRSVNHMNNSRKRPVNTTKRQTTPTYIPTIVLDDDEPPSKTLRLTKVQYNFYYKKFNLKPCKVLLSRCDAH